VAAPIARKVMDAWILNAGVAPHAPGTLPAAAPVESPMPAAAPGTLPVPPPAPKPAGPTA
jgi:hypothetical protein